METIIDSFQLEIEPSRYPPLFLEHFEPLECLSRNRRGEKLLVKERATGEFYVAMCYTEPRLLSQAGESDRRQELRHPGLQRFAGEYRSEHLRCVLHTYASGEPLGSLVRGQPLGRDQAVSIALQLCDIVEYLHAQTPPVLLGAIKPQALILDEKGRLTLIDFGCSRRCDRASQQEAAGIGPRCFAAPEQFDSGRPDRRSDIYTLGLILCWMLTGRVDVEAALREFPDRRLAGVVARCTAPDPNKRYPSAARVRAALTGRRQRLLAVLTYLALASLAVLLGLARAGVL